MNRLNEKVRTGFRQWDEQRLRLRLLKQQLRQRKDQPPDEAIERLTSELRTLEGQCNASLERLLALMRRRRPSVPFVVRAPSPLIPEKAGDPSGASRKRA